MYKESEQKNSANPHKALLSGDIASPWRFCIAPMLDRTDRHYRYLARLMTRHARLYTEMVTTGALLHGDVSRHLQFNESEHPVALQIGGSNPADLAACAILGVEYGYDEINLNVGCPSDRVQNGSFGACLMATPEIVAEGVRSMREAVDVPVTVKTRVGIDRSDSFEAFSRFIDIVAEQGGCEVFIIHARKAWLDGLSPKENREIPPLRRDFVYRIQDEYPELTFVLNGKLETLPEMQTELAQVPGGIMVGRAAYEHIDWLRFVDQTLFDAEAIVPARSVVVQAYRAYMVEALELGTPMPPLLKPLLTLFNGLPGARAFRRYVSEQGPKRKTDIHVLDEALVLISDQDAADSAELEWRRSSPYIPADKQVG
ncbi:tRNA dihydrouridine(20/20a) synthase DusA [Halothiobacillus sp.]|uniref:tRNA dihydrouridine(20/20a) synthase DusA n=1 Tax=Halothiobacillus sp. TaxID=1891311 RepID=UPI00261A22E8|nr:tRNA dihydrouridine(20/20a) synthase DusA [Halothiobacillus sp.]